MYVRGRGIVLNEPSVVATNTQSGAILAVGAEAKRMTGRTPPHIVVVRPLKDGVIADFDVTEKMLRYFLHVVYRNRSPNIFNRPRVVVAVPSGITGVEQRAVEEACIQAGARAAWILEEPMAAARGAGRPVHEAVGTIVVDIRGGTPQVAAVARGGRVPAEAARLAGDDQDEPSSPTSRGVLPAAGLPHRGADQDVGGQRLPDWGRDPRRGARARPGQRAAQDGDPHHRRGPRRPGESRSTRSSTR